MRGRPDPRPSERGAFHLLVCADERPSRIVLAVPANGLGVVLGAREADDARAAGAVTLEPHARSGLDLLLALSPEGAALAQNGLPAPPVALLRPGDEIRLDGGTPLFVDFYREPPFVRASAAQAGVPCQLCRGPIEAGRRIYQCACGALTHADGRGESAELLDCAVGTCSGCTRAIVSEPGYVAVGADGRAR
jgi:hypothetical protein